MTTVKVKKASGGYAVTLKSSNPDDFNFAIGTLKSFIHSSARSYDPDARQWHVDAAAEVEFERWITNMRTVIAATIEWLTPDNTSDAHERAHKPHTPAKVDPFATLHLLPSAPPEVVRAAYKALAIKHHPDKLTGDTRRMQEIVAAYKQLAA
jgi:hypothetical protein